VESRRRFAGSLFNCDLSARQSRRAFSSRA
jgi:hypothetical protein